VARSRRARTCSIPSSRASRTSDAVSDPSSAMEAVEIAHDARVIAEPLPGLE